MQALSVSPKSIRNWINFASRYSMSSLAVLKASSHETQEIAPARPHGCTVCIWFREGGQARRFMTVIASVTWRFEVCRIVQEGLNEATILSLVATGLGVGWVLGTARWRSPETVVILPVIDLNMLLALALVWRRDNTSPLLVNFIGEVQRLPGVRAVNKGRSQSGFAETNISPSRSV